MRFCKSCGAKIVEFSYIDDKGVMEKRYFHDQTAKKCQFKTDGIDINIADEKTNNLFIQTMETESVSEEATETVIQADSGQKIEETTEIDYERKKAHIRLGNRLMEGSIDTEKYQEILDLLENG